MQFTGSFKGSLNGFLTVSKQADIICHQIQCAIIDYKLGIPLAYPYSVLFDCRMSIHTPDFPSFQHEPYLDPIAIDD